MSQRTKEYQNFQKTSVKEFTLSPSAPALTWAPGLASFFAKIPAGYKDINIGKTKDGNDLSLATFLQTVKEDKEFEKQIVTSFKDLDFGGKDQKAIRKTQEDAPQRLAGNKFMKKSALITGGPDKDRVKKLKELHEILNNKKINALTIDSETKLTAIVAYDWMATNLEEGDNVLAIPVGSTDAHFILYECIAKGNIKITCANVVDYNTKPKEEVPETLQELLKGKAITFLLFGGSFMFGFPGDRPDFGLTTLNKRGNPYYTIKELISLCGPLDGLPTSKPNQVKNFLELLLKANFSFKGGGGEVKIMCASRKNLRFVSDKALDAYKNIHTIKDLVAMGRHVAGPGLQPATRIKKMAAALSGPRRQVGEVAAAAKKRLKGLFPSKGEAKFSQQQLLLRPGEASAPRVTEVGGRRTRRRSHGRKRKHTKGHKRHTKGHKRHTKKHRKKHRKRRVTRRR